MHRCRRLRLFSTLKRHTRSGWSGYQLAPHRDEPLLRWVNETDGLLPMFRDEAFRLVLRQEQTNDLIDSTHQPITPAHDRRAVAQTLTEGTD